MLTYEHCDDEYVWPLVLLVWTLPLRGSRTAAQTKAPDNDLDRQFQAAVAQYDSGHYAEAAAQLEKLLPDVPQSFEVHELLGLGLFRAVPGRQGQRTSRKGRAPQPAIPPRPHTNLAANLVAPRKTRPPPMSSSGKPCELEPENFDANHNLGEAYVRSGKIAEATPFLEKAQRIDPSSYDNGYDLSLAYLLTGHLNDARS